MAQLQKKFIANNAVDGSKIRLSNNENLKARNAADSADVNILKVNASDRVEFASLPQVTSDPSAANDLVRKSYVDSVLQGLKPKQAVRAATVGSNINLANALENGDSLDGVTLATGDRVLVKDQTSASENGIYIVQASGAAVRSTDFDSLSPIDEINGAYVAVQEGSVNAGKLFVQAGTVATIGTDPINFVFFNSVSGIIGGDMITVSGSNISVDLATTSGLESTNPGNNAGQLRVKLEASTPTLQINGSNELGVKFSGTTSGLEATASGLAVNTEASNPSLEVNGSGELKVKYDTAAGLNSGASGLAVQLDAAGGLEFNTGSIRINVDATNGTSKVNASNELEVIKKEEEQFTLNGTNITNQYIDLAHAARAVASISLTVLGGLTQERGVDYTVSLTGGAGGVTRITFAGDLATAGAAELISGDKLVVSYEYL